MRAVDRMEGKSPSNRKKRVKQAKSDNIEVNTEQKPEDVEITDKMLIVLTQFVEEGSDLGDLVEKHFPGKRDNSIILKRIFFSCANDKFGGCGSVGELGGRSCPSWTPATRWSCQVDIWLVRLWTY